MANFQRISFEDGLPYLIDTSCEGANESYSPWSTGYDGLQLRSEPPPFARDIDMDFGNGQDMARFREFQPTPPESISAISDLGELAKSDFLHAEKANYQDGDFGQFGLGASENRIDQGIQRIQQSPDYPKKIAQLMRNEDSRSTSSVRTADTSYPYRTNVNDDIAVIGKGASNRSLLNQTKFNLDPINFLTPISQSDMKSHPVFGENFNFPILNEPYSRNPTKNRSIASLYQEVPKPMRSVKEIVDGANTLAYTSKEVPISGNTLKELIGEINLAKRSARVSDTDMKYLNSAWRSLYTRGQTEGILNAKTLPDQLIQDALGAPGGGAGNASKMRQTSVLTSSRSNFIPYKANINEPRNQLPLKALYRGKEIDPEAATINPEFADGFVGPIDPGKIFRRVVSPSQPLDDLDLIINSKELWGNPNYNGDVPTVSALRGWLPEKDRGLEFITPVPLGNSVNPNINGQVNWGRNVNGNLYPGMKAFQNPRTGNEALSIPIKILRVKKEN